MPPMVTGRAFGPREPDFVTKSPRFKPPHPASRSFPIDILLQCSKITVYL